MPPPIKLGTLVIASGQTDSNTLSFLTGAASRVEALAIAAPDTLPETVTVHVLLPGAADYNPLRSSGADVVLAPGKTDEIDTIAFGTMKLIAGGAVGGDRTFVLSGREEY